MQDQREIIAEQMLEGAALRVRPGTETPLIWDDEAALENSGLRHTLCSALAALCREHYAAADAVMGGAWAEETAALLGLPCNPKETPRRPVFIAPLTEDAEAALELLLPIQRSGGSPAAAVLYQNGNEKARVRMDKADVRCHWLTDLEAAAAEALRSGRLDFEDYCVLLPQSCD